MSIRSCQEKEIQSIPSGCFLPQNLGSYIKVRRVPKAANINISEDFLGNRRPLPARTRMWKAKPSPVSRLGVLAPTFALFARRRVDSFFPVSVSLLKK